MESQKDIEIRKTEEAIKNLNEKNDKESERNKEAKRILKEYLRNLNTKKEVNGRNKTKTSNTRTKN